MLLVVLFHGGTPDPRDANAEIDVLFILSGSLTTHILLAESQATASLDLRRYYRQR